MVLFHFSSFYFFFGEQRFSGLFCCLFYALELSPVYKKKKAYLIKAWGTLVLQKGTAPCLLKANISSALLLAGRFNPLASPSVESNPCISIES